MPMMGVVHFGPVLWSLVICVAITLSAIPQAVSVGILSRDNHSLLYFVGICVLGAAYIVSDILFYTASTIADADVSEKIKVITIFFYCPIFVGFITSYTQNKRVGVTVGVAAALTTLGYLLIFIVAGNLRSVRYSEIARIDSLTFPWGEVLSRPIGPTQPASWVVAAFLFMMYLWAVWRTTAFFRSGHRRGGAFLAASIALIILANIAGRLSVIGALPFIHPFSYAFMALIAFMTVSIGLDYRDQVRALAAASENLRQKIWALEQAESQISHLAYHDPLTNLPNRTELRRCLARVVAECTETNRKGAVILFDLANLKVINDALGPDVGDHILRDIAGRMRPLASPTVLVARLEGCDLAVVLTDAGADHEEAQIVARETVARLRAEILAPIRLAAGAIELDVRWGLAVFPEGDDGPTEVIQSAKMALNRAKEIGHEVGEDALQFYMPALRDEANGRLELETLLRRAVERGEMTLHFQPQLDVHGAVVGAETLLRWHHPEKGTVAPAQFIPLAERSGLIHPIGQWVLDQACDHLHRWTQDNEPFTGSLSINVSAWQFGAREFEQGVTASLDRVGDDAKRIILEITESAFMQDVDEAVAKIEALRRTGVKFSIDDFGTGFASLAYLQKLPVDELKIDQSFVRALAPGSRNLRLVQSIIDIGRSMDLLVVAEGVETEYHFKALAAMRCAVFQGYHFAKPMPEKDFLAWIRKR